MDERAIYAQKINSNSERMARRVTRMKVDACIWTKNSSKFLPITLKAFDNAVPKDVLGQRIMVDDHSEDKTISLQPTKL